MHDVSLLVIFWASYREVVAVAAQVVVVVVVAVVAVVVAVLHNQCRAQPRRTASCVRTQQRLEHAGQCYCFPFSTKEKNKRAKYFV